MNLALSSLAREFEDANEREDVLKEIRAVRRKPEGLTEAISESLRQTHHSLSAHEVRYWLEREGFDLSLSHWRPIRSHCADSKRVGA